MFSNKGENEDSEICLHGGTMDILVIFQVSTFVSLINLTVSLLVTTAVLFCVRFLMTDDLINVKS